VPSPKCQANERTIRVQPKFCGETNLKELVYRKPFTKGNSYTANTSFFRENAKILPILFRKNAKALRFDVLIEKEVVFTSPKKDQHRAIQVDQKDLI
jgi:hypothetical protein